MASPPTPSPPRVLALLTDFMFKAKFTAVASRTGATLRFAASPEEAARVRDELKPNLVLADLHAPFVWEALEGVGGTRVIGFYSHVDTAIREQALQAGVEPMPRSKFVVELPALLGADPDVVPEG